MMNSEEKIFTETELRDMGAETVELIQKAIDARDLERAKKINAENV